MPGKAVLYWVRGKRQLGRGQFYGRKGGAVLLGGEKDEDNLRK